MAFAEEIRSELQELRVGLERAEGRAAAAEGRAARAEGQSRRAVAVSAVVALAAVTLGLAAPGQSQVTDLARKGSTLRAPFRVVDNKGRVLLQVRSTEGGGSLALHDNRGRAYVTATNTLDHETDHVTAFRSLAIHDEEGVGRIEMTDYTTANGHGRGLGITDEEDRRLIELGHGGTNIGLRITHPPLVAGETIRPAIALGILPDGSRGLSLFDDSGSRVGSLGANAQGASSIQLLTPAGQTTFSAP